MGPARRIWLLRRRLAVPADRLHHPRPGRLRDRSIHSQKEAAVTGAFFGIPEQPRVPVPEMFSPADEDDEPDEEITNNDRSHVRAGRSQESADQR